MNEETDYYVALKISIVCFCCCRKIHLEKYGENLVGCIISV